MADTVSAEDYAAIETFKLRRVIRRLNNGGSLITVIIPAGDQITVMAHKLVTENGAASNIKNRVNRQSVLEGIAAIQHRLKQYSRTPENGLCIFAGRCVLDDPAEDGRERKFVLEYSPFRPVQRGTYYCGSSFVTQPLEELLQDDEKYGFIIMDGHMALFANVQGNTRTILQKFSVDLPKKHRRGGQSSVRFARLRTEKRHNYVRRVAEVATECFISEDKCNVQGLVLAGSADFKTVLSESSLFDPRLQSKVISIVDISYGGEQGLNQAIELSQSALGDVKLVYEKKVLANFFNQIARDTGLYSFGMRDTLACLENAVVDKLIVWDMLEIIRVEMMDADDETIVKYLSPQQLAASPEELIDPKTQQPYKNIERENFAEWLAAHYTQFSCSLEIVSDKSPEGTQFVTGFGGIGAVLRYRFDTRHLEDPGDADSQFDSDLDDFM